VPQLTLSTDGNLLAVKRFDISADGQYLAFEDFGALYLMPSCDKYDSSYERIVKRIKELVSPANKAAALEEFFTSVVLSCAVRNGDAHLKNFGVLYTDPEKDVRLAPAFDIVCTQAYLPNDAMALTLNGSTRFPKHREIERFGRQICGLSAARVTGAIDAVCAAISQASIEMNAYASDHPEFAPLAGRMLECWEDGLNLSCRPDDRPLFMLALPEEDEGPGETELG
jgi:serine/threonine-protein kinase HipA